MSTKKRILELFESRRGQTISGGYIAGQFNVSRNAVWKAVKELEKDGYKIEAAANKGYCFCEDNDILSAQGMLPFLSDKKTADRIYVYPSLESTNKTAKEMAISDAGHGTIIIADRQTAGKGRYGRDFFSPPLSGIYISFILRSEQLRLNEPTLVTSFAAVSVCEAIEAISEKKPQIKWVNDIFLDGKKICGILTEAVTDYESGNIPWIVAGIGINFSTSATAFPEELREIAGAVFTRGNPPVTRNRLAAEVVNRIMDPENQSDLTDRYKKRLMMLGKTVLVTGAGVTEPYEATAVDIDGAGRLVVKKDNGETLSLSSGEIRIVTQK